MSACHVKVDSLGHLMESIYVSVSMVIMRMTLTQTYVQSVIIHVQLVFSQELDKLAKVVMLGLHNIECIIPLTPPVAVM